MRAVSQPVYDHFEPPRFPGAIQTLKCNTPKLTLYVVLKDKVCCKQSSELPSSFQTGVNDLQTKVKYQGSMMYNRTKLADYSIVS